MGTGSRKSSHHQRSGSNPINPSSSNSIPSHANAVSATSEDYVDMSPAGSASGSRPGAVPIPNRYIFCKNMIKIFKIKIMAIK